MRIFLNFLNELYYTYKFSDHIKQIFNSKNKKLSKKIILVETNRLYGSHIGYAYLCNKLREKYSSKIYMIKTNFFNNGVEKILHLLALKLNLLHYRIYRSFCSNFFLYYKKKNNDFSKYKKYLKKINTKNDLQNFKIDGILYGDLIYDSYLREKFKYTINLNDNDFIKFFYKSIDYYFYCKGLFERYDIKAVILSHTVYIPAILGRIALHKKKLF